MSNDARADVVAVSPSLSDTAESTSPDEIARLHEVIAECTRNCRRALSVAAVAALYQLAAVAGVSARDVLAATQEMELPLIGARTPLTGFFVLSSCIVAVVTTHLHGQLLMLARLVGELARAHRAAAWNLDGVYPWAPLHAMLWWALRRAGSRTLAAAALTSRDAGWATAASQTRDLALRLLYVVLNVGVAVVAFPVVLGVALFVYGNGGEDLYRWVIAVTLAVTMASGITTWVEVHVRLTRGLPAAAPSVTRLALPVVVAALSLLAAGVLSDRASFAGADLAGLDLRERDLRGADLRYANLTAAQLTGAHLEGADAQHATLALAVLRDARLADADLSYADLRGAKLRRADLRRAIVREATLDHADLTDATTDGVDWAGATGKAVMLGGTELSDCRPGSDEGDASRCCFRMKDGGAPIPQPKRECDDDITKVACVWLHSGTRLESVPSWLRERLPALPGFDHAKKCRRKAEATGESGERERERR